MAETGGASVTQVLNALADLAPSAEPRSTSLVIPTEWFRWLPLAAVRLFLPAAEPARPGPRTISVLAGAPDQGLREVPIDRRFGSRLAAVDQLRPTQRSLRAGWLFVAGRVVAGDGRSRRVFHPLVTVPVRCGPAVDDDRVPPQRLVVLVSADPPKGGLVDEYLIHARTPPGAPRPVGPGSDWSAAIAAELTSAGLPVTTSYPTGRHAVDICLSDPARSVGIECEVHPDGAEAHIQRHLDLRRAGWDLFEAYRSRWMDKQAELVVRLVNDLRPSR
jgi:hypothetical protein